MKLVPAAVALARKDLRIFFRDRTGMLLGFLLPIALVTIFGYLMGLMNGDGGGSPMARATIWVADEDGTEESAALVEQLRASSMIRLRPRIDEAGNPVDEVYDAATLRQRVIDGEADIALLIGEGFAAAIAAGDLPELTLVRDPGRQMESQLAGIGLMQAMSEVTQGTVYTTLFADMLRDAGTPEFVIDRMVAISAEQQDIFGEALGEGDEAAGDSGGFDMQSMFTGSGLFTTEDHAPPDRDEDVSFAQAQAVGGIAVMMVLFGLTASAVTLLRERDEGTMRRLLSLPLPPAAILLGKAGATLVVGMIQITLLFLVGEILFGIGIWRDPLTLIVLMLSTVAAASAFGLLIAGWAKTPKQAEGMSTLLILVMSCLGGSWFPLQMLDLPAAIEVAMRLTINHWAVSGYQELFWRTSSLADSGVQLSVAMLWLFTVAAGFLALRLFRRNYLGRG
ncbi:MAG: ABC transporter permease [Planctomycetota bacterium]|jgi:ABC-2 type transport system permease protein